MKHSSDLNAPDDYNLDYLSMVTDGDNNMKLELATHIFNDSPILIAEAIQSAFKNDWNAVAQVLHKLKGQLGILSMKNTMNTIVELEELCKTPTDIEKKINLGLEVLEYSMPLIFNRIQQELSRKN